MMMQKGREIVSIHVGQCGLQMGHAMWELFNLEHNIGVDGKILNEGDRILSNEKVDNMYYETRRQRYVPFALLVDLEPTVVDEIRTGPYRELYNPRCLINGAQDAANNYARGYFTVGKNYIDQVMESLRRLLQHCDNLATFQVVHSFCGGTGSGLTSVIVEKLTDLYGKKFKFGVGIYPSAKQSQAMVDPYNTILMTHATLNHMDCVCGLDNETLYNVMYEKYRCDSPTFTHVNRLIAQMVTSVTLAHRFRYLEAQYIGLNDLLTNLIPYPKIHYPMLSYAPMSDWEQQAHDCQTVETLTDAVFNVANQTIEVDNTRHKYFSCAMLYRGDTPIKDVSDALLTIKASKRIQFVDWCPTGFKVGTNIIKPIAIPNSHIANSDRALCMIAGNACIREAWNRVTCKFDLLHSKRAFVHWYVGEGMEEGEFSDARDTLSELQKDYEEVALDTEVEGGGSIDVGQPAERSSGTKYSYTTPKSVTSIGRSPKSIIRPDQAKARDTYDNQMNYNESSHRNRCAHKKSVEIIPTAAPRRLNGGDDMESQDRHSYTSKMASKSDPRVQQMSKHSAQYQQEIESKHQEIVKNLMTGDDNNRIGVSSLQDLEAAFGRNRSAVTKSVAEGSSSKESFSHLNPQYSTPSIIAQDERSNGHDLTTLIADQTSGATELQRDPTNSKEALLKDALRVLNNLNMHRKIYCIPGMVKLNKIGKNREETSDDPSMEVEDMEGPSMVQPLPSPGAVNEISGIRPDLNSSTNNAKPYAGFDQEMDECPTNEHSGESSHLFTTSTASGADPSVNNADRSNFTRKDAVNFLKALNADLSELSDSDNVPLSNVTTENAASACTADCFTRNNSCSVRDGQHVNCRNHCRSIQLQRLREFLNALESSTSINDITASQSKRHSNIQGVPSKCQRSRTNRPESHSVIPKDTLRKQDENLSRKNALLDSEQSIISNASNISKVSHSSKLSQLSCSTMEHVTFVPNKSRLRRSRRLTHSRELLINSPDIENGINPTRAKGKRTNHQRAYSAANGEIVRARSKHELKSSKK